MTTYLDQVRHTYTRMADECRYRPAAPSDGLGNITVPLAELDLNAEVLDYARSWRHQEDEQSFYVGCPSFTGRPALILAVEAARLICGVDHAGAARLLRMAADELERTTS